MKIAIFGATGDQGGAQYRQLLTQGHAPFAVTRRPQDFPGAAVYGDFSDAASLANALTGADAVFLNLPSSSLQSPAPLIAAASAVATAAAAAGVGLLVFNTSMPAPQHKLGFASQDARIEMRQRILAGNVPSIIFQPGVFLDNLVKPWAWPAIAQTGTIVYPHLETLEVSWICHNDLAALMAAAVERPQMAGRIFPVGGPETVCGPQLAKILSSAWGRNISFRSQPIADFVEGITRVFQDRPGDDGQTIKNELARIYHWYNTAPEHPFRVDMRPVLAELPVQLTSIRDWALDQNPAFAVGADD